MAKKYVTWTIPDPPQPIKTISIPAFKPVKVATLFSNLPNPAFTKSSTAYLLESNELQMYNQGFVLYETVLTQEMHYLTVIIRDFAVVTLNGNFLSALDRSKTTKHSLELNCTSGPCTLQILVEAMGHINFDHQMETDKKGLFFINDTKSTKFQWNIYKMNVDENILNWKMNTGSLNFPALSKATFSLTEVGDTFINLYNYKKGYVWVNGHNLGRYWNIGPSQKVFCPGVWLKAGQNELYILDLLTDATESIRGDKTLK
jgi:beta-galactosidase